MTGPGRHYRIVRAVPEPGIRDAWLACLARADYPAHYTSPAFIIDPLVSDKRPFAILAVEDERVVAALTGVHEGGHVVSGLIQRPQVCFDATADTAWAADTLARGLLDEAAGAGQVTVCTWTPVEALDGHGFRVRREEGVATLDLREGSEALFRKFSSNRRLNVRKAIRSGVEVSQASTTEEFLAYHAIQVDWSQRKRLPARPFSVLEPALRLRDHRRLFLARHSGRVIAGLIVRFYPGGLLEYAANSWLADSLDVRPNDLLHWRAIQWGVQEGLTCYSLCGTHLFLLKFGGTVVPTYRYRSARTWFRRHDPWDVILTSTRRALRRLPPAIIAPLRHALSRVRSSENVRGDRQ